MKPVREDVVGVAARPAPPGRRSSVTSRPQVASHSGQVTCVRSCGQLLGGGGAMRIAAGHRRSWRRPRPRLTPRRKLAPMGLLDDKVAIVTGAGQGIGRGDRRAARRAGREGGRQRPRRRQGAGGAGPRCRPTARSTPATSPRRARRTSSSRRRSTPSARSTSSSTTPATRSTRPVHKMSDDWFQRMLDIHLIVPFRVIRAAAPHLREPAKKEREEGTEVFRKIVNVSSTSGTFGNAGQANYSRRQGGHRRPDEDAGQGVGPVQDQRQRGRLRLRRHAPHAGQGRRQHHGDRRREGPARHPGADARDGVDDDPARPPGVTARRPPAR